MCSVVEVVKQLQFLAKYQVLSIRTKAQKSYEMHSPISNATTFRNKNCKSIIPIWNVISCKYRFTIKANFFQKQTICKKVMLGSQSVEQILTGAPHCCFFFDWRSFVHAMNYVPMQIDTSPHEVWKSMRIRAPFPILMLEGVSKTVSDIEQTYQIIERCPQLKW